MRTRQRSTRSRQPKSTKRPESLSSRRGRARGRGRQVKISSLLKNEKQRFNNGKSTTGKGDTGPVEFSGDDEIIVVGKIEDGVRDTIMSSNESPRLQLHEAENNVHTKVSGSVRRYSLRRQSKDLGEFATEGAERPREERGNNDYVSHTYTVLDEKSQEEEHKFDALTDAEMESILRDFDTDSTYGPCRGITRMERLDRVNRYRFLPDPPSQVAPILRKWNATGRFNTCVWDQRFP